MNLSFPSLTTSLLLLPTSMDIKGKLTCSLSCPCLYINIVICFVLFCFVCDHTLTFPNCGSPLLRFWHHQKALNKAMCMVVGS